MKIIEPSVRLLSYTANASQLIEVAGRTAYQSTPGSAAPEGRHDAFVKMLMDREHLSVIEHAHCTILIVCDRGISHE